MGAIIRIYAESFERDPERHSRETQVLSVGDFNCVCESCSLMENGLTGRPGLLQEHLLITKVQ